MIQINTKGQMGIVVALITGMITGIIALAVLSNIAGGFCEGCLQQTNITQLNVDVTDAIWYNNTCVGDKCDTDFTLYCNNVALEAGVDYSIDDCDFRVDNIVYNATDCTLEYTAVESEYNSEGILGTIMCLMPVLAALGLVVLAVGWAML